jgi:hypothetical protein
MWNFVLYRETLTINFNGSTELQRHSCQEIKLLINADGRLLNNTASSVRHTRKKHNLPPNKSWRPRGWIEASLYPFFNRRARWGCSRPRTGRFTPRKDTRYPSYRKLGGTPGRSGRVWKILPPPGFYPKTVQPVASRSTDWAFPVLLLICY